MTHEVMARFKKGDQEAFHALFDRYADRALRLARAVTKDDAMAADAVQEAFLRAYLHRKRYDPARPFPLWLNRIVVNECRRLMAKDKRLHLVTGIVQPGPEAITKDRSRYEEYEALYNALEVLPETQRIPLVLKYCNGCKEAEIAGILNISQSAVKSRLYDGRRNLKKALGRENGHEEI